ncbi:MAG: glycosyltransferase [Bacteroidales bacterium]|nr:glycosyltransferase [Bacteroidales bacterium]
MRVLFVTYHYLNGNSGATYASRAYINSAAAIAESLVLLCPVKEGKEPEGIDPRVEIVAVSYDKSRIAKALDLIRGRLHRYYDVFDAVLGKDRFDIVIFDACYSSFGLMDKAHKAGCKVVVIHHNYQLEYVKDSYGFPRKQFMLFWTRRCERAAVHYSDLNLVLTDADRRLLMNAYDFPFPERFVLIGVFESSESAKSLAGRAPEENVFVITGTLSARQTEDSLLPWLKDYYPLLNSVLPGSRLIVAGGKPGPRVIQACESQGVELVANPPVMSEVIARAKYYICPTDKGGGLKLRIMDGLKNGLPVLTHEVSARGYDAFMGKAVFSYSDRESFVNGLSDMTSSAAGPQEIMDMYASEFSFASGVERMRIALDRLK